MKKIIQKIKLRKFKNSIPEVCLEKISGDEFIVLYRNDNYKRIYSKSDLIDEIVHYSKDIYYIFDMVDRIILDKDIIINANEIGGK